ncbi:ABC transporter permease [Fibrisoma montanum]|uniref:ABC transporter permease n=1 Tax=Fibrisoma montanum TaxID=2305895 RepID=A0A418LVN4_9BACT|nr:ABC transporter permease [Fibrisoma montanum]RIV17261.1 ABC transporter permease [Fibrisoma montanum]
MLHNYLTIAFRNLWKNKVFTGINVAGLALGIAAFVLILEYVGFERSTNQFHANLPTLYRLLFQTKEGNTYEIVSPAIATVARQQFGEISDFCRVSANSPVQGIVSYQDTRSNAPLRSFRESDIAMVDSSFFDFFSFSVVAGSGASLREPNTVAISESTARRYFGRQKAIGKRLTLNNNFGKTPYTVTAVYQDMPANSDLQLDMVFSLKTFANPANLNGNGWAALDRLDAGTYVQTFFKIGNSVDVAALEQKINAFKKQADPKDTDLIRLQPVATMHLGASLSDPSITYGNLKFVYLLTGIAILILVIAWFNYVNLSTAGSLKRAKEVGVRKVVGANKSQLIGQFLGESLLLNILGFGLALFLVASSQNAFNEFVDKPLSLAVFSETNLWLIGIGLLLAGSLASGAYTAFALTSYQPTQALKGLSGKIGKGAWLRQSLVVFQFSISLVLIIATVVLYRQLQYVQHKDLGMNLEQLLVIQGPSIGPEDKLFDQQKTAFRQQVSQLSYINEYTSVGAVPGNNYNFTANGIARPNPRPGDDKKGYAMMIVDDRYLSTFGIKLAAGSNFTPTMCELAWEKSLKVMLNETAAKQLGFTSAQEAVGKLINWGQPYEVVGVMKDYHHQSLRQAIDPMIFLPRTENGNLTVRLTTDKIQAKIAELERLYKKSYPGNPFDYFFVDERYDKQYEAEKRYSSIFTTASCLAIFIACLGLFGLAMFTAEQRTKEIGVRKVLGASVASIVTLLSKDFLKLVCIAIVIATPIAAYATHQWLQNFAYKIDLEWWMFALAGILAASVAILTISFQSIKAALMNPVKSLRTE